jgi:hypothetical protein
MHRINIEYKQRGTGEYFAELRSYKDDEVFELFYHSWIPPRNFYITDDRRKLDKVKKDIQKKLKEIKGTVLSVERKNKYETITSINEEVYEISSDGIISKVK